MKLYCSKCRSALAHAIGRGKNSKEDYADVRVVRKLNDGLHECVCNRCKNTWISKAKSAKI